MRFNERELLITNIVRQSWYDTLSGTVSRKIIMAPPTGTQQFVSYCSYFSVIIVWWT